MDVPVRNNIEKLLNEKLQAIEAYLEADVFAYSGQIVDANENAILNLIEELAADTHKKNKLVVILTTPGGSANAVERYVNILRHHYEIVDFIVPNYAYSAGTIFCMSGDNIYMDYFSVLGPIDPQVQNKEGKWVAAMGYLDKIKELLDKATANTITNAEFLILKDFDLAEIRGYEQARDLTTDLLKKWLVQYKFKNWTVHRTDAAKLGQPVTPEEKQQRAEEIAMSLSNNGAWKSHGRPINLESIKALRLEIIDYSLDNTLRPLIRDYYGLLSDWTKNNTFVHTRKFI